MAIRFFLILIAVFLIFSLFTLNAEEENISGGYFINIENGEKIFYQRLTWKKVEYTRRYEVIIQRIENNRNIEHLKEFTQDNFIIVSLPPNKYRFQVIPYDIMDKPGKGSEWKYIEVYPAVQPKISGVVPEFIPSTDKNASGYSLKIDGNNFTDKTTIRIKSPDGTQIEPEILEVNNDHIKIKIDEEDLTPGMYEFVLRNPGGLEESLNMLIMPMPKEQTDKIAHAQTEQKTEKPKEKTEPQIETEAAPEKYTGNPYFNSIGISLGTSFVDPLFIASVHGTYSPFSKLPNLFFQLGADFGFISKYDDVEKYFSFYPFLNAGYFLPFRKNIDFFAGAGAGYMLGEYAFSYGTSKISDFGVNLFAGVILFDMINITYGIRTDFASLGHRLTAGYIYRFPMKDDTDKAEEKIEPSVPVQQERLAPSEKYTGNPYYNTVGVSLGTSFIDPLLIATLHGTYSPIRNFFLELGCDFGFISKFDDVEKYYSIYPFLNAGYFLPFRKNIDFFAGAGAGYMTGKYTFSYGTAGIGVFAANFFAGVNLFDIINISYTLRTDFGSVNHKLSAGYTYRFARRNKNAE